MTHGDRIMWSCSFTWVCASIRICEFLVTRVTVALLVTYAEEDLSVIFRFSENVVGNIAFAPISPYKTNNVTLQRHRSLGNKQV